jgi:hypothetical protein
MSDERVRLPVAYTCTGFTVATLEGDTIGRVGGVTEGCFVVEIGRWPFQRLRAIPFTRTHVHETDKSVISLPAARVVRRSPHLHPNRALDEAAVLDYYEAALPRGIEPVSRASTPPGASQHLQ